MARTPRVMGIPAVSTISPKPKAPTMAPALPVADSTTHSRPNPHTARSTDCMLQHSNKTAPAPLMHRRKCMATCLEECNSQHRLIISAGAAGSRAAGPAHRSNQSCPMLLPHGIPAAHVKHQPCSPEAAEIPCRDERYLVVKSSTGVMKVVALGPKLAKKKVFRQHQSQLAVVDKP